MSDPAPGPAIDPAAIERLRELGGTPFVIQMLDIFATYVPVKIREIETGVLTGDLEAIRAAAHPLKSSASNIGATTLRALATRIETAATPDQRDQLPPLAAALVVEHARVTESLAKLHATLAG